MSGVVSGTGILVRTEAGEVVTRTLVEGTNVTLVNADGVSGNITVNSTAEGGEGSYTDEEAQDAVGTILTASDTIEFTYTDATPTITADIVDGSVTLAKLVDATAQYKLLGRSSASAGSFQELTSSANVFAILTAADYAAIKTLLSLTIGSDVQGYDADLAAIGGVTSAADKVPYFTGVATADVATFNALGRSIVGAASALAARTAIGVQPGITQVVIDADLAAHTSSTLGNVTGLALPVVNGNLYNFRFNIFYRSEFASNGLGLHLTMPAGTVAANIRIPSGTDTGGTAFFWTGRRQSSGAAIVSPTTPVGNTHMLATIEGTVTPTADGNLQVQMASEDNSSDIIIKAGTNGILWDLGVL